MSRLVGYALHGAVFLLFGAKWSWQAAAASSASSASGTAASAAPSAPPGDDASEGAGQRVQRARKRRCSSSCPLEGLVKLCVAGVGVVASLVAAYPDGSVEYVGDVLHATIYLFFALSGLADVLAHYCFPGGARSVARAAFALAFFVEGALFLLAPPEVPSAERRIVALLVVAVWGCAFSVALEGAYPALAFVRCIFTLVHGSWFVHVGFLMHWQQKHRTWDTYQSSHEGEGEGHVWVSLAFAWHLAAALSLILVLLVVRRGCSSTPPAVPEFDGFGAPPRHPHGPCPFCDGLGGHHHAPC